MSTDKLMTTSIMFKANIQKRNGEIKLFNAKGTRDESKERNDAVKYFGEEAVNAYEKHGYTVGVKDIFDYGGKTFYIKPLKGEGETIEIADCCGGEDFTKKLMNYCGKKLELDETLKGKLRDWYLKLYDALDKEIYDVQHVPDFLNHTAYGAESAFKRYYGEEMLNIFKDNHTTVSEMTYNASYMKAKIVCFPESQSEDDYCFFYLTLVEQGKEERNKTNGLCEALNRAVGRLSVGNIRTAKNIGNEEHFFPTAYEALCNLRNDAMALSNQILEHQKELRKAKQDIDR